MSVTKNPASLTAAARGDWMNALIASTPGGIERQEKAGQRALVNSTNMPIEMRPSQAAFEKVCFKFGDKVDGLFLAATLPEGWTRAATDHSMHSKIIDAHGRERVSIFYKAAFYDRRAYSYLVNRFRIETQYHNLPGGDELADGDIAIVVKDGGTEVYRTAAAKRQAWSEHDALNADARAWLAERYPNFADPTEYWD